MIRKLLVIAAAIAMPVSLVALAGGSASAAISHSSTSDTIICKTITGTVKFSPKLDKTGYTNQAIKTTVTATIAGCTVKGTTAYKVSKGTITGTITGVKGTTSKKAGTCTGLLGSSTDTGTLTSKWSVSSGAVPPPRCSASRASRVARLAAQPTGRSPFRARSRARLRDRSRGPTMVPGTSPSPRRRTPQLSSSPHVTAQGSVRWPSRLSRARTPSASADRPSLPDSSGMPYRRGRGFGPVLVACAPGRRSHKHGGHCPCRSSAVPWGVRHGRVSGRRLD